MSSTVAITVDGVLRHPRTRAANLQGMLLYNALATTNRLALLTSTDEDTDWFLKFNGLTEHAFVMPEVLSDGPTSADRRIAQVGRLRQQGCAVESVIDPDPEVAAALYENGIPVMLYLHPQYTQPSFRPDYKSVAKPWDSLVSAVDYQIQLRTNTVEKDPLEDD